MFNVLFLMGFYCVVEFGCFCFHCAKTILFLLLMVFRCFFPFIVVSSILFDVGGAGLNRYTFKGFRAENLDVLYE